MRMLHDPVVEKKNQAAKLPIFKRSLIHTEDWWFPMHTITLFLLFGLLTTGSEEGGPHWWQGSACIVPGVSLGGTTLSPNRRFHRHGWEVPPPVKNRQLQLMWMRRSSSSSSATLARRAVLSKQTNFGTGQICLIFFGKVLQASVLGGHLYVFVVFFVEL